MNTPMAYGCHAPGRDARRAAFGLSVIGLGTLALLDNLRLFDMPLLRTFWPLVFCIWGTARLAWPRHAGSRFFGVLLILVGTLMTAHNLGHGELDLRQWWPVFLILAGSSILVRGLFPRPRLGRVRPAGPALEHADVVEVDATFSGIELRNDSRRFQGGRIALTFAGLELDLRDAVMDGQQATLQVNATFSSIELRVPRDWQVVVQIRATMGNVEDRSTTPAVPAHRLILVGETVIAGVEIMN